MKDWIATGKSAREVRRWSVSSSIILLGWVTGRPHVTHTYNPSYQATNAPLPPRSVRRRAATSQCGIAEVRNAPKSSFGDLSGVGRLVGQGIQRRMRHPFQPHKR